MWKILGLFVNTLIVDDKHSLFNKDSFNAINSDAIIQERKSFSPIFNVFFEFRLIFERFEEKDEPHTSYILEIIDCKRRG